jgi:uncharacterized membrane protein YkvA (DUF1232 family)
MLMGLLAKLRTLAGRLKRDTLTLYFAARDPRTPWTVRLLALAVAAYALSPIDLIPDFIPVLGYLDDLLLLPLGILLVIKLLPDEVIASSRARAASQASRPRSTVAALVVVSIWLLCAAVLGHWLWRLLADA